MTPGNWSTNALPGPQDDVTINVARDSAVMLQGAEQVVRSVSVAGELRVTETVLAVAQGVTLVGGADLVLSGSTTLAFRNGHQTLGGDGDVIFADAPIGRTSIEPVRFLSIEPASLTIGAGVTIRSGGGSGGVGSSDAATFVVNEGLILADAPTGTLDANGVFRNASTMRVTDGNLRLTGDFAATGRMEVAGGVLELSGLSTQAGLGAFVRTGGDVIVTGTLVGGLTLNAATGSWELIGGTLSGGVYSASEGAQLVVDNFSAFENLTVASDVNLNEVSFQVHGDLTLANHAKINLSSTGGFMRFDFDGVEQTLGGEGEIVIAAGDSLDMNFLHARLNGPARYTIDSGVTIRTEGGGGSITVWPGVSVINKGTIITQSAGHSLNISGDFINLGAIRVLDGTMRMDAALSGDGALDVQGGALELAGNIAQASLGAFHRTGGEVNVTGAITGGLTLDASTGSWNLAGGLLLGGTYSAADGAALRVTADSRVDSLTIASDLLVSNSVVGVTGGLTLSDGAAVRLTSDRHSASLDFLDGGQTLGGRGEVRFEGRPSYSNSVRVARSAGDSAALTIGPDVTIRAVGSNGVIGGTGLSVANFGVISVESRDRRITLSGDFTNAGMMVAREGGAFVSTGPFDNKGSLSLGAQSMFQANQQFITSGSVALQIGEHSSTGSGFAQINGRSTVTLGGVANIGLVDGFQPGQYDSYALVQASSVAGSFGKVEGLVVDGVEILKQSTTPTAFIVNGVPPLTHVTDVFVSSSQWRTSFMQSLASQGLGDPEYGYRLGSESAVVSNLPWTNLNQISIRFDQVAPVRNLDLTIGARTTSSIKSYVYSGSAHTSTWWLAPGIDAEAVMLYLAAKEVTTPGRRPLDGEFNGSFPTGDGVEGGDFGVGFTVLPADVNRSGGAVNAADLVKVRNRVGRSAANPGSGDNAYSVFTDVNGDGVVNAADLVLVRNRVGTSSPAVPPPSALMFSASRIAPAERRRMEKIESALV